MHIKLPVLLLALCAWCSRADGQCTVSVTAISSSGPCSLPSTLKASFNSKMQGIDWKLGTTPLQTYNAVWTTNGVTVAGGNGSGSNANQFAGAIGVFVDGNGNVYVPDNSNHRIQKWVPGATSGVTVAGGNSVGSGANQFDKPIAVYVVNDTVYVVDQENNRIQKWAPGATSGITVAGGNGGGANLNQLQAPRGIIVGADGTLYIADQSNNRIVKWVRGATSGVVVAGGNGSGSGANQFNLATGLWIDRNGNIYVSDYNNHRVQKWTPGATTGTTVAGTTGTSGGTAALLWHPINVWGDTSGNIYVADFDNHRIQRWAPGATSGTTVAGTGSSGSTASQLYNPAGVFVDSGINNIYIADYSNQRIQRFSWNIIDTLVATNPGTYNVTVTGVNGCSATASIAIGGGGTTATATASGPTTFCFGDSVIIKANKGAGLTYKWQYGTVILTSETKDSIIAKNAGDYRVIITTGSCTTTSTPVTVTTNSLPSLTLNTNTPVVCAGKDTTLIVAGANTYVWAPPTGLNNTAGNTVKATPANTTTYTITGTDINGCKNSITRTVQVNTLPPVAVTPGNTTMCAGEERTFTASGANTYSWTPATGLNTTTGSIVKATPANTATYVVTGTDNNGCTNTVTRALTVNALPVVSVSPSGSVRVCQNIPIVFMANNIAGATYQWKHNTANTGSNSTSYTATISGNYKVVVTDANSCKDSSAITSVTIYPIPLVSITPHDTAFCAGNIVQLHVVTADTGLRYQWRLNGANITGATLPFYGALQSGEYKVVAGRASIFNCTDSSLAATVTVHPLPMPVITWDGNQLSTAAGYKTYKWYLDGQPIADATNVIATKKNGTYVVAVTDSNGCTGTSPAYKQQVGLSELASANNIRIYPNPASDRVYIDAPIHLTITMYDMQGREILQQSNVSVIDISNLAHGLYIMRVADENGTLIKNEKITKAIW